MADLASRIKNIKAFYPKTIGRAFPFGDSVGNALILVSDPLSIIPSKRTTELLVDNYINKFETTHPLLDLDEFHQELGKFWLRPNETTPAWQAQLLMMLALSCYASPPVPVSELSYTTVELSKLFIDGAEALILTTGRFMTKPTISNLRTLCMLAIAKHLDIVTFNDSDSLWSYIGFLIRLAMSESYHISPDQFPGLSDGEAKVRTRIWTTIMTIAVTNAFEAGMPMLLRQEDYETSSVVCTDLGELNLDSSPYRRLLAKAFPVITSILNIVNSIQSHVDSNQTQLCDMALRQLLQDVQTAFPEASQPNDQTSAVYDTLQQRAVLSIFIHRALLALHHEHIESLHSSSIGAEIVESRRNHDPILSRCVIQESSSSLLQLHEALHNSPSDKWLAELHAIDFGIAGIHLALCLRSHDYDENSIEPFPESSKLQAWSSLKSMHKRMREDIPRSLNCLKMYQQFSILIAVLESQGTMVTIEDSHYNAGIEVLTAVEEAFAVLPDISTLSNAYSQDVGSLDLNQLDNTFAMVPLDLVSFNERRVLYIIAEMSASESGRLFQRHVLSVKGDSDGSSPIRLHSLIFNE
jgi:hypothetical protein